MAEDKQTEAEVHELVGFADGEVLESRDEEGKVVKEKIVYDYEETEEGLVFAGFHKEAVKEEK